ncbi:hypothetical protein CYMTET_34156 [Cymbomonas tetramitiformis]|uniref:Uncharacterized protein n=1 Tax=Cymbomonas tetramitiformis TaxID=36881 RepID=A0AAE0FBR8_9CHLO|nr:hypothetical protein CYMTET_34156 [Cymbomonas tetramitiformis]
MVFKALLMVRPVESVALWHGRCGVGTCCAKHSRVLAFDKWVDKITRSAISENVSEAQELEDVVEEEESEATHVEVPEPELEVELEHEEMQVEEPEVGHKMPTKRKRSRLSTRRNRLPVSDSPRFKASCGELQSVLHTETCKRIERRGKKDDRDEREGVAPKAGWDLGWWFNMGRTAQQWGFSKKKDGTSAFSLKHPFFNNRGVYLGDPLVSKSNPYWKKEIFMLAGELLKCVDARHHGVHGDWCLYVSCMMSDMCEVAFPTMVVEFITLGTCLIKAVFSHLVA